MNSGNEAAEVCKSPTHKAYADAIEGLYIQTWIAHRDLSNLLAGAPENAQDSQAKGTDLLLNKMHKLDEVVERIAFGKRQIVEATAKVTQHMGSGRCRAVAEKPKSVAQQIAERLATHEHVIRATAVTTTRINVVFPKERGGFSPMSLPQAKRLAERLGV